MEGGRTGTEDGNGTFPRAGDKAAPLCSLTEGTLGTTDGFRSRDKCCESTEGRRAASIEGQSLSRDGWDLSRDGWEVETVDEVCRRLNEG